MPPKIDKEIKPEKDAPLYRTALTAAGVSIRNGPVDNILDFHQDIDTLLSPMLCIPNSFFCEVTSFLPMCLTRLLICL